MIQPIEYHPRDEENHTQAEAMAYIKEDSLPVKVD
jgi:hypothetical protein